MNPRELILQSPGRVFWRIRGTLETCDLADERTSYFGYAC